ncbi:MAG: sigma-70 family RNA polymerase sigma factor, partial [Planctomycetota bacterium]
MSNDRLLAKALEHEPALKSIALRVLGDSSAADDVLQEVWLAALDHPADEFESAEAWLAAVTRNVALSAARSQAARKKREHAVARHPVDPALPHQSLERQDVLAHLMQAVDGLGAPYASALSRHFMEGLSLRQIAKEDGRPLATVESWVRRGLERLRLKLEPEYGDSRAFGIALLGAFDWTEEELRAIGITGKATGTTLGVWATVRLAAGITLLLGAGAVLWHLTTRGPTADEGTVEQVLLDPSVEGLQSASALPVDAAMEDDSRERTAVESATGSVLAPVAASDREGEEDAAESEIREVLARVVTNDDLPVSEAIVWKFAWNEKIRVGVTDARGEISVPIPTGDGGDPGRMLQGAPVVELAAARVGHADSCRVLVPVDPLPSEPVVLKLQGAPYELRGTVVDEGGVPVARARVYDAILLGTEARRTTRALVRTDEGLTAVASFPAVQTDERGIFVVEGLPKRSRTIGVTAEGFADVTLPWDVASSGGGMLHFELKRELVVEGTVLGAVGLPAAGASVRARVLHPERLPDVLAQADQAGRFVLRGLNPGVVLITASLESERVQQEVQIKPGIAEITLQLAPSPMLRMAFVDEAGEPLSGVSAVVRGLHKGERSFLRKGLQSDKQEPQRPLVTPAAREVLP